MRYYRTEVAVENFGYLVVIIVQNKMPLWKFNREFFLSLCRDRMLTLVESDWCNQLVNFCNILLHGVIFAHTWKNTKQLLSQFHVQQSTRIFSLRSINYASSSKVQFEVLIITFLAIPRFPLCLAFEVQHAGLIYDSERRTRYLMNLKSIVSDKR